ncbi:MAG: hypothetical protein RR937_04445, partial [Ruthenibacterium sp.]
ALYRLISNGSIFHQRFLTKWLTFIVAFIIKQHQRLLQAKGICHGKTKGLAACYSQTTSPLGYLIHYSFDFHCGSATFF